MKFVILMIGIGFVFGLFAKIKEHFKLYKSVALLIGFTFLGFILYITNWTKFLYFEYLFLHVLIYIIYFGSLLMFFFHFKTQIILISLGISLKEYFKVKYEDESFKKFHLSTLSKNLKKFLKEKIIDSDLI